MATIRELFLDETTSENVGNDVEGRLKALAVKSGPSIAMADQEKGAYVLLSACDRGLALVTYPLRSHGSLAVSVTPWRHVDGFCVRSEGDAKEVSWEVAFLRPEARIRAGSLGTVPGPKSEPLWEFARAVFSLLSRPADTPS